MGGRPGDWQDELERDPRSFWTVIALLQEQDEEAEARRARTQD